MEIKLPDECKHCGEWECDCICEKFEPLPVRSESAGYVTYHQSRKIWDYAIGSAVDSFNGELTDDELKQRIRTFRGMIDDVIEKSHNRVLSGKLSTYDQNKGD